MASGFMVAPQQQPQAPPAQQDPLEEWRSLAQQVQQMIQKYPEAGQVAAPMLQAIKQAMTLVASNPQRSPERQAPPVG